MRSHRPVSSLLTFFDGLAAALLAVVALTGLAIGVTQRAGAFGAAAIPAIAAGALTVPVLLIRIAMTPFRRAPGRSGRWTVGMLALAGVGVAAVPIGEAVDDRAIRRREARMIVSLERRAQECAADAARTAPDEVETNPGVEIRPRYTRAVEACVEAIDTTWAVTCFQAACEVTPPPGGDERALTVVLVGYMDDALRRAGAGPWNRSPQPGFRIPAAPWVERVTR